MSHCAQLTARCGNHSPKNSETVRRKQYAKGVTPLGFLMRRWPTDQASPTTAEGVQPSLRGQPGKTDHLRHGSSQKELSVGQPLQAGGRDRGRSSMERLTSIGHRIGSPVGRLSENSDMELFALYGSVMRELLRRRLVRTANAPAGDYAEYLVASALGGELAPNSVKSWDLKTPEGRRVQVKCRVLGDPPKLGERQLSPFRSFEFDDLVIVLFAPDYSIRRATQLPAEAVKQLSRHRAHVNGHVLMATDSVLSTRGSVDLTQTIRNAAEQVRQIGG